MRHWMTVFAGTLALSLMSETAAIAQVTYYRTINFANAWVNNPCYEELGMTSDGERLKLDSCSIDGTGKNRKFLYYLNGQPKVGTTDCDLQGAWCAGDRMVPAVSHATQRMLDRVCNGPRR
ncbi:MAG: hypothetical protein NW220_07465 [Leptolyngbyaceae cyanobacterium bins.349]|nr:hypothetical protein [Leptolyngbyaceae cyanobacterium bins.349]